MNRLRQCILLYVLLMPLQGHSAERVCKVNDEGHDYTTRWMTGIKAEVGGFEFYRDQVFWESNGAWRTKGTYQRNARYDSAGLHRIYLNETRYEFKPEQGQQGVLHVHVITRLTHPEDEARVRQYKYDYPLPAPTSAKAPIQTTGFEDGVTYARYVAACHVP